MPHLVALLPYLSPLSTRRVRRISRPGKQPPQDYGCSWEHVVKSRMRIRTTKIRHWKRRFLAIGVPLLALCLMTTCRRFKYVTNDFSVEINYGIVYVYGDGLAHRENLVSANDLRILLATDVPYRHLFVPVVSQDQYGFGYPDGSRLDVSWSAEVLSGKVKPGPAPLQWTWLVRFPIWPLAAPAFILGIWYAWRDRPFPRGCCRRCGYALRKNVSGVCPECGDVVAARP